LDRTGVTEGYCVQLGADAGLAFELAKRSDLRIWCVEADPERVALARRALEAAGLYGVRVTVHEGSPSDLGYPQYLADLVIVGQGIAGESPTVHRLLKPGGGVACLATSGAVVARRAPLQGAGQWTHQYANAGRTGASDDSAVRVPVRMQWFGKPGPAMMVTRHWRGPAPLCVDGRLFVIGQFRITAVDAYNGRELWVRDLPKAGRFPVSTEGGNAAADEAAVYVAVEDHCLRLDMATGETVTTYEMPGGEGDEALWDYIGLDHDLLLGTSDGGLLFALDKETGQPRWTYEAQFGVHHDSVAVGEGGVFLIDSPPAAELDKLRRRGQPTRGLSKLVRLDLQSGETVWATPSILPRRDLRLSQGVLLATGGGRMSAYSAETGDILSWGDVAMQRFPVVVGDTIYGQPHAYNLTTGERLERVHPLTGEMVPWSMHRSYGCGSVSGAPNLLAFRSSTLGFYDLADDSGIHNYGAIRAGCYVNAIMAAGLVLMPPGDAGCTCSYNFQTTVALAPTQRQEEWAVFATGGETTPVRHAHLNLGAPGDRRDEDGRLWLGVPRPAGLAVPLEVKLAEDGGYYHHNADQVEIAATDRPWIYATGVEGVETLTLTLEREEPATYHVRLHFAEPSGAGAGERVFDVRVGQQTVLAGVDVAAEAGGGMAALVREFDVEARHAMSIEFVRRASQTQPPILSAIEVEEQ
ncbi:MAG: malectin domain-containing carbohydrate-binding protein, partial [Armatimonadota bacterium]